MRSKPVLIIVACALFGSLGFAKNFHCVEQPAIQSQMENILWLSECTSLDGNDSACVRLQKSKQSVVAYYGVYLASDADYGVFLNKMTTTNTALNIEGPTYRLSQALGNEFDSIKYNTSNLTFSLTRMLQSSTPRWKPVTEDFTCKKLK